MDTPGEPTTNTTGQSQNRNFIPMAIIIAGVIVAGSILYTKPMGSQPATSGAPAASVGAAQPTQVAVNVKDVKTAGEPYVGQANAPVTLAYWSDYQCPFCKQFENTTFQTILQNYVNAGKVRVVFKDFAFLGNDSITGAEYARAVWDLYPDKFLTWREAMFKAQDQEGDQGFGNEDSIVKLSATIPGIDAAKLKAQVAAKKTDYDSLINADRAEGTSFNITGTPGFVTGTQLISGAQPLPTFTQALDSQLSK